MQYYVSASRAGLRVWLQGSNNMPYLSDDEIDGLVSRAVSKAIGNQKEEQRAATRDAVSEIADTGDDEKLMPRGEGQNCEGK
jgi:hypothetical protein